MQTATAAKPSPDYRTISPEEILSAHEAGVPVPELLLDMCSGESIARRDGRWYLTTTAALAAGLWEPKDGCEMIERPAEVAACEAVLRWLAGQEFDHMCPSDIIDVQVALPPIDHQGMSLQTTTTAVLRASRALDAELADWTPPAGVLALRPTVYAAPAWERYVRTAARSSATRSSPTATTRRCSTSPTRRRGSGRRRPGAPRPCRSCSAPTRWCRRRGGDRRSFRDLRPRDGRGPVRVVRPTGPLQRVLRSLRQV